MKRNRPPPPSVVSALVTAAIRNGLATSRSRFLLVDFPLSLDQAFEFEQAVRCFCLLSHMLS